MSTVRWIVLGLIALMLLVAVGYMKGCDGRRALGDQKKIEKGQTGAVIESSQDAMNSQAGVAANDVGTSNMDRKNAEEIRNAEGSDAVVSNQSHNAALRSLCRRAAYRDRAECRVQ